MFEFFFKYPPAVFSKGKFVLLGSWPVWVLIVLILASASVLAYVFWRKHKDMAPSLNTRRKAVLWALQCAFITLLLLLLWEPALSVSALRPQQNIVAVVVDDSLSMGTKDTGTSRRDEAARLLDSGFLSRLRRRFQVRLYKLGADTRRIQETNELHASEPATHLGAGLDQLASESGALPIGAVVLLSDGADNSGGVTLETLSALRARRLPVSTIGFGKERLENDVELEHVDLPARTLASSRIQAQVSIRDNGFDRKKAKLSISDGVSVLASRDVLLKSGQQSETLEFNAGNAGPKTIYASIDPLPGEENAQNNRLTRVIDVDGETRRILYMEGEPRWDYKFLRRAVEDDPALHIVSLLRTTQNKLYRQGVANAKELVDGFPTKPDDLFAFDGLILGSVESAYFTDAQQQAIQQFVDRRGGGLLFLGGRASLADGGYDRPPFKELLPVNLPQRKNTFRRDMAEAYLTDAGKQSLICRIEDDPQKSLDHWKILPYLASYQDAGTPKPGAVVLAQMTAGGAKLPLLITENYGRGRTAVFATGGSWRWQMQQPVEDMSHEMFWRQLLRWLVSESPSRVTETTQNTLLSDSGEIRLTADVRDRAYMPANDATVAVRIEGPEGISETLPLRPEQRKEGIYTGSWTAPKPGAYIAEVTARRGAEELGRNVMSFRREDGVAENFHREQNRDLLEKLASETGGHYFRARDAGRLVDEIAYSDAGITARETMDLWNMPIVFLLAIALRSAEWLLRRRWSVV
jgi:uncharacterized membrane protein